MAFPLYESETSLPADVLASIDRACDRFEEAWQAGERPSIEATLAAAPPERRAVLFAELLALEVGLRQANGESCGEDEYAARFPDQLETIRRLFQPEHDAPGDGGVMDHATPASGDTRPDAARASRDRRDHASAHELPAAVGKYRIVAWLGGGGQGEVYRAIHPTLNREVVIKLARRAIDDRTAESQRLIHEGRALAELDHPHLVRVFDLDVHEQRPFLVLDFVRGQSLRQHVADRRVSPREAARLVAQVARALAVVHARGMVHLDIKPDNVMVDDDGAARLIDFGLAVLGDLWSDPPPEQGHFRGTPAFAAPEQAAAQADRLGRPADMFALGALLFYAICGRSPYDAASIGEVLQQAAASRIDFRPLQRAAPRRLAAICRRAMSIEPADRYPSAAAMAEALERFAAPARRRGPMLAATFAVVVALAVAAGAVVRLYGSGEPAAGDGREVLPTAAAGNGDRAQPAASSSATSPRPTGDLRPQWNRNAQELRFDGQVIRRVRTLSQAGNIVCVLDAFESAGWPEKIDSPFPSDFTAHRLHAAVQSLNEGLERIRFRGDGVAMAIRWAPAPPADE